VHRRRYLAAVGAAGVAGVAGCLGRIGFGGPTGGSSDGDGDRVVEAAGGVRVRVETVATDLVVPWGVDRRGRDLFVTERPGRVVRLRGGTGPAETLLDAGDGDLSGLTPRGEGGLLGLAFHPDRPYAYTYGTYGDENRLYRHDLTDAWARDDDPLLAAPAARIHDGGRLVARARDGRGGPALWLGTGDASRGNLAQKRDSLAGKVLRVTTDGRPYPGNPFDPESPVYTYGHRNVQGLAFRDGVAYAIEHGPDRDDEVNRLRPGRNYGWPRVTGGGSSATFEPPIESYTPTIAPGGAVFYPPDGPIRAWRGDLFVAALKGAHLRRLRIETDRVTDQEVLLEGAFGRLRTPFVDSEGHLRVTTSNRDGRGRPQSGDDRILRLAPA
jgi:glucose/arabinose dehydrogenase